MSFDELIRSWSTSTIVGSIITRIKEHWVFKNKLYFLIVDNENRENNWTLLNDDDNIRKAAINTIHLCNNLQQSITVLDALIDKALEAPDEREEDYNDRGIY